MYVMDGDLYKGFWGYSDGLRHRSFRNDELCGQTGEETTLCQKNLKFSASRKEYLDICPICAKLDIMMQLGE